MPSSVLLALVVAAGVLILMPALAHRYDTALRGQAELRASSMRVLPRERRRRTVPAGGPVRPPTAVTGQASLITPAAVRTAQGVSPGGRGLAAVRASLVREVIQDAPKATGPTRVRVRRPAGSARPTRAIPVSAAPVSPSGGAARPVGPVSVVPASRTAPAAVPATAVRRAAEVQRARRRRLVLMLALLVAGQAVAGFILGAAFWIGAVTSALAAVGLLTRLRVVATRRQRREAQARQARVLIARARQHRAEAFVRRALRQAPAGVEREAWLGPVAVRQAAAWLALPRIERDRPARNVIRVLAAAGREAYLAADGSWAVRPVPRPAARTRTAAGATPAARREARAVEAGLPRVVNG